MSTSSLEMGRRSSTIAKFIAQLMREGLLPRRPKHYPDEDSGFVFDRCRLTSGPDVTGRVYLGRPWRPYASVVFLDTQMGEHIDPAGWREWHPGETHSIETVFYAEFNSTGPGARQAQRDTHTHLLTPEQATQYEPSVFLRGSDHWDPVKTEKIE